MNSLICFLTVFHILQFIRNRWFFSRKVRRLVYLGIFLPVGDYILRLILGELWFSSGDLVFHSFIYQAMFWSMVSLIYWVYNRDLKGALEFYIPLAGLFLYWLFSLFSTESLYFLAPFHIESFHLNWINAGYFIPTMIALALWGIKKWSEMSNQMISKISLACLLLFLGLGGIIWNNAKGSLEERFGNVQLVHVSPANNLQTEWQVVSYDKGVYHSSKYHFVQEWQGDVERTEGFDDFEAAQSILMDPVVMGVYKNSFKNPVLTQEIQSEVSVITIKELNPSIELFWLKEVQILKNRSGQIIDFNVQYGTVI